MTGPQSCDVPPLILVAEDDPDTLDLVATVLELRGFRTATALDGSEAWSKAVTNRPDLVLTNVGLPVMDGFTLASRLRSDERTRGVPIVAVTGWVRKDLDARAREAGIERCLVKPVLPDALVRVIDGILDARRSLRVTALSRTVNQLRGRPIKADHPGVRGRAKPVKVYGDPLPKRSKRAKDK